MCGIVYWFVITLDEHSSISTTPSEHVSFVDFFLKLRWFWKAWYDSIGLIEKITAAFLQDQF